MLLSNGDVLVHEGFSNLCNWYRFTPDIYGSYINGTWSTAASIPQSFGYCPWSYNSAVLPNGHAIIMGAEANSNGPTNLGAIYDPVANGWTLVPAPGFGGTCGPNNTSWCSVGEGPSVVLPNGNFMVGIGDGRAVNQQGQSANKLQAMLTRPYNPSIRPWIEINTSHKNGANSEEGWTLLPSSPGHSRLLTVNTYADHKGQTVCNGYNSSEILLLPSPNNWYCLGDTPDQLYPGFNEVGPALLRPDGTVFAAGATQYTAILNTNFTDADVYAGNVHWTRGPTFPADQNGNQLTMDDAPVALLPNRNLLMMTSAGRDDYQSYASPICVAQAGTPKACYAVFLELTPYPSNVLIEVPGVSYASAIHGSSFGQMLVLPTDQIWFTPNRTGNSGGGVEIYTPANKTYDQAWAPRLINCSIGPNTPCLIYNNKTNILSGFGFGGMSQGSAFGDEYQSASNYPLVRITGITGGEPDRVYYCQSHDFSEGVATGNLFVSTQFDCPNLPTGLAGILEVVVNGIPSKGQMVQILSPPPDNCLPVSCVSSLPLPNSN